MIKLALQNWKTSSTGVAVIAGAVIHLAFQIKAHTGDEGAWTFAVTTILGGIGLIAAGDATAKPVDTPNPGEPR